MPSRLRWRCPVSDELRVLTPDELRHTWTTEQLCFVLSIHRRTLTNWKDADKLAPKGRQAVLGNRGPVAWHWMAFPGTGGRSKVLHMPANDDPGVAACSYQIVLDRDAGVLYPDWSDEVLCSSRGCVQQRKDT